MFLRSHMSADTLSPLRLASSDRRVGGEPPATADVPGKVSTSLSTSPFELLLQLLLLIALLASKTKMPSSPPAITPSIFSISVESSGKQPRDGATIQLCSRLVTISKFLVGASGMSDSTVQIAAGAVVCARAIFEGGDISIGPDTVVFSGARISCSKGAGPVVIGRGCVLEEGSSIECVEPGGLCVGEGNLFEVGCTVRSPVVGDYNVFQPKCVVDRSVKVASGCFIGPKVTLNVATTLPDNVSVFRLDAYPDEYRMQSRPRNTEYNRAKVNSYRTALASQGKKYSLGKYNQLLPSTTSEA